MADVLNENKKITIRSYLKKYFPPELCKELNIIAIASDIDNNGKRDIILDLLSKYNIPYSPLGSGTNRYAILLEGYAVKIALDRAGKVDNMREFKYSRQLQPYVIKVYECFCDGLIAVTEYITVFTIEDLYINQPKMRDILKEISKNYLIGDIGVSPKNYLNWGYRTDLNNSICILDFAYIYSLSYKTFKCDCSSHALLNYDSEYINLRCPHCKKKYTFEDVRRRIKRDDEANEIGNLALNSYVVDSDVQLVDLDPRLTETHEKPKKEKKPKPWENKEPVQDWDFEFTEQPKP